jgi:Tetratricopeptide repeat
MLQAYSYLGEALNWKGDLPAAEMYLQNALKRQKEILGAEHLDTLTSMGNLASTYSNQGRWKEAEGLEVQVMEISSRVLRWTRSRILHFKAMRLTLILKVEVMPARACAEPVKVNHVIRKPSHLNPS